MLKCSFVFANFGDIFCLSLPACIGVFFFGGGGGFQRTISEEFILCCLSVFKKAFHGLLLHVVVFIIGSVGGDDSGADAGTCMSCGTFVQPCTVKEGIFKKK